MSLQFNDSTNYRGIIQILEKELGFKRGDISGDTNLLKEFTADINLAFDDFLTIAIPSSGTWQYDDSNHTDYPEITTNLVASQRDYPFSTDEGGNLILDIYKVMAKDTSGVYQELTPVDKQTEANAGGFFDGRNTTGTPIRYDKTANGIFLDPIPNYNSTNGLKVFINREASYFTSTDTTKKPGVPGLFHRWFAIKPAYDYARTHNLDRFPILQLEVSKMEEAIKAHFSERPRDERRRLSPNHLDSNK